MTKSQETLTRLLQMVESKTEYTDGTIWGTVYLPNVGNSHSFAGCLAQLRKSGDYRPMSADFGEVKVR
jgi:hypothetical protein